MGLSNFGEAEERRQRGAEKERDGHGGGSRPELLTEEPSRPRDRREGHRHDAHRLPHQVRERQRQAQPVQRPADREHRLQVDVAALREAEQVRGQPPVGARVTSPGEVLELVGAQHAVGADQPVGSGEPGVKLPGVDEQQNEREERPGREARQ